MKIEQIDSIEYSNLFGKSYIPYNSVEFNLLNAHKCDRIAFFLLYEGKIRLGLIAGVKSNALFSPFSAPFSSFSYLNQQIDTEYLKHAIIALEENATSNHLSSISYTLPPCFYNESFISKLIFCFYRENYSAFIDVNHTFKTENYVKYENGDIDKDIRYKIRVANKAGLVFRRESNIDGYKAAFEVIYQNKLAKNRSQNLTFEQIIETANLIDIDFFVVYHNDRSVASSIVYNINPFVAQVIYWGNLPEYNNLYTMNFLAMNMFRFYGERKIDFVDLGTSMKDRDINQGLCKFKESIGAQLTLKFSFNKTIKKDQNVRI